jgi:hypothetical protein
MSNFDRMTANLDFVESALMSISNTMADLLEECRRFAEGVSACEIDFTSVEVIEPHIDKLNRVIADLREAAKP